MTEGKYVKFDDSTVIVFTPDQVHARMAEASGKNPVSAGFFETVDSRIQTYGRSDSLDLDSNELDASVVSQAAIAEQVSKM